MTAKPLRILRPNDVKPRRGKVGADGLKGSTGLEGAKGADGSKGLMGVTGADGIDGATGADGLTGATGKDAPSLETIVNTLLPSLPKAEHGKNGDHGKDGRIPAHEIDNKNLRLRFQKPDGAWGKWLDFKKFLSKIKPVVQQVVRAGPGGGGNKLSTEAQAREGTDATSSMSPLRVDQAIASNGMLARFEATKTSDYTILPTDGTILVDASSGDVTITLPDLSAVELQNFRIKRIDDSSNKAFVSGPMDSETSIELERQWYWLGVQASGSNYLIFERDDGLSKQAEEDLKMISNSLSEMFEKFMVQFRKMNMYFAEWQDDEITDEDIGEE